MLCQLKLGISIVYWVVPTKTGCLVRVIGLKIEIIGSLEVKYRALSRAPGSAFRR